MRASFPSGGSLRARRSPRTLHISWDGARPTSHDSRPGRQTSTSPLAHESPVDTLARQISSGLEATPSPSTGSFATSATSLEAPSEGAGLQQKLQLPECSAGLPASGEWTGVCLHRRLCGRVPSAGRVRAPGVGPRGLGVCLQVSWSRGSGGVVT